RTETGGAGDEARDCPVRHFHSSDFFCHCSGDHQDLHSFPTRRSSDLGDPLRIGQRLVEVLALEDEVAAKHFLRLGEGPVGRERLDRKSTRLNSSHRTTSYAVFCLKKKTAHRGRAKYPSGEPPTPSPRL